VRACQAALQEKSQKLRYLYSPTHAEGSDDSQKGVMYKRWAACGADDTIGQIRSLTVTGFSCQPFLFHEMS
jgi:hypothetical protein